MGTGGPGVDSAHSVNSMGQRMGSLAWEEGELMEPPTGETMDCGMVGKEKRVS